jgi:hypothetical protein
MLKDLMYQARVNKDYGITTPYEDPKSPTPAPQLLPTIQPLPPIEDFLPEFEVREPETTQTMGQLELTMRNKNTQPTSKPLQSENVEANEHRYSPPNASRRSPFRTRH